MTESDFGQLSFIRPRARVRSQPKRDPLFDAWVETWGEPVTKDERGRVNAALRQLREIGATADDVRRALRAYDQTFPGVVRSPQGITRNWTLLVRLRQPPELSPACPECGLRRGAHDAECSLREEAP